MNEHPFSGKKKLPLTALEWLVIHHKIKEKERKEIVEDLKLNPGDYVLDLGCGPGLWTTIFAEHVQPSGLVFAMDFDSSLIVFAKERLRKSSFYNMIHYIGGDILKTPFRKDTFDLIFCGNCLSYCTNPEQILLEEKRITKKGGKIVGKDFDGGTFIVHPIDPYLTFKIITAAAKVLYTKPLNPPFDNFFGRKMHGLFIQSGLKNVQTTSYAINKTAPLSEETKQYIKGNALWLSKVGAPFLSKKETIKWNSHFERSSSNYVLERNDFYFCMLEIQTIGHL